MKVNTVRFLTVYSIGIGGGIIGFGLAKNNYIIVIGGAIIYTGAYIVYFVKGGN